MRLVLASSNAGKLEELRALLRDLPRAFDIELISQRELGIAGAPETASSFVENALGKARHASRASGLAAIADDSGLVVPALNGAPGIHSARFSDSLAERQRAAIDRDEANNKLLLERLTPHADRRAYFYCALVLLRHAEDPVPIIATGAWWGEIARTPRGNNGFGYDPLFLVPGTESTSAELRPEQKNRLSHRGLAMAHLRDELGGIAW